MAINGRGLAAKKKSQMHLIHDLLPMILWKRVNKFSTWYCVIILSHISQVAQRNLHFERNI